MESSVCKEFNSLLVRNGVAMTDVSCRKVTYLENIQFRN